MAILLSNAPQNFTEYPNSFRRQGAYPLEYYSVFKTLEEAKNYAKTDLAYVGQPFSVSSKKEGSAFTEYYVVADEAGTLFKLGDSSINADEIDRRLKAIEKFFADFNNLDSTLDTLSELQGRIKDIYYIDESDNNKEKGILGDEITRSTAKDAELQGLIEEEARTRNEKYEELQGTIDNLQLTEEGILLNQDLYTYVNIGKITGASDTNRVKIAGKGESLKKVFNAILGTRTDKQPTITNNASLSASKTTTSYGDGKEWGTDIPQTTINVTFTLANTGTASYGYRVGQEVKTGAAFYYPIVKQGGGDLKIVLPENKTATVISGEIASSDGNTLYCNFNDNKQIEIQIELPQGSVTLEQQTRYGEISASVQLGAPVDEEDNAVTSFLTYLESEGEPAQITAPTPQDSAGGTKTAKTGPYIIKAGSYSPYYLVSILDQVTTIEQSVAKKYTGSSIIASCAEPSYVWFLLPPGTTGTKTIQYKAMGDWYNFDGGTTGPSDVELTLNTGAEATYKAYRTIKRMAAGETEFRIV